jgi:hypothetical protein
MGFCYPWLTADCGPCRAWQLLMIRVMCICIRFGKMSESAGQQDSLVCLAARTTVPRNDAGCCPTYAGKLCSLRLATWVLVKSTSCTVCTRCSLISMIRRLLIIGFAAPEHSLVVRRTACSCPSLLAKHAGGHIHMHPYVL